MSGADISSNFLYKSSPLFYNIDTNKCSEGCGVKFEYGGADNGRKV